MGQSRAIIDQDYNLKQEPQVLDQCIRKKKDIFLSFPAIMDGQNDDVTVNRTQVAQILDSYQKMKIMEVYSLQVLNMTSHQYSDPHDI